MVYLVHFKPKNVKKNAISRAEKFCLIIFFKKSNFRIFEFFDPLPPQTQKYIGETRVSFQLTHIFQLWLPKLRFDSIRDSHTRPLRNLSSQLFVFVLLVKIEILFFDIPHYHTRKLQKGPFSKYRNFEVTCFDSFFLSF